MAMNMRFNLFAKMQQHRAKRRVSELSKPADGGQLQRLGEVVDQRHVWRPFPLPCVQPVRISTIFCDPIRHGTHFPHDSLRKNFTAFSAMSSMQRPSAQTTIAQPDPSIDPMAASDLKSSRTSTSDAGKISRRRTRRSKRLRVFSRPRFPRRHQVVDYVRHRQAHRDLKRRPAAPRRHR